MVIHHKKAIACSFVILSLSHVNSFSQVFSGNDLHKHCKMNSSFMSGYVSGFLDKRISDLGAIRLETFIKGADEKDIRVAKHIGANVCIPDKATIGQIMDVVCKYIGDHPEVRHLGGADISLAALQNSWPCPQERNP